MRCRNGGSRKKTRRSPSPRSDTASGIEHPERTARHHLCHEVIPILKSAFLTTAETVALLGIPRRTFYTHYCRRFTDARPADRRTAGVPRLFRRVEVEGVVEHGWEWLAAERAMAERAMAERRRKLKK